MDDEYEQTPTEVDGTVYQRTVGVGGLAVSYQQWSHPVSQRLLPLSRKPRKRQTTTSGGIAPGLHLNFDVSGPYEAGFDQRSGRYKYFLAASFSVPARGSTPLSEGLRLCGGGNFVHSDVEQGSRRNPGGDQLGSLEEIEAAFDAPPQEPEEEYLVPGEEAREELSDFEVEEIEVANAKWREIVEDLKDVEMRYLTFAIPLTSRHGSEITRALSLIYVRLRSMNLPVIRCHSDRAKEFISRGVQQWMLNRNIYHTFSAGDEAAGCGQIENLVNVLKGRTRALMKAAKCERTLWPLAVRFAAEQRMRDALGSMGIRLPVLIPFGASASAKVKRWHRRLEDDGWNGPYRQVRVWGPACDMSPTSHGYFIEADGHWMRSTVIVRGRAPPPQLDLQLPESGEPPEMPIDEEASPSIAPAEEFLALEEEQPVQEQEVEICEVDQWAEIDPVDPQLHGPDPPKRRVTGKQHVPVGSNGIRPILRALRIGGEWSWELDIEGQEERDHGEEGVDSMERAMLTLQHREAQQWLLEEKSLADYEQVGEITMAVQEEINNMEKRLRKMELLEAKAIENECLVTRTVDLAEVRQDLQGWREAILKEYESLLQHGAIKPISGPEFEALKKSEKELEVIPAKLVATIKPPSRRKARLVGCGNMVQTMGDGEDLAASGIDTIGVRTIVDGAATRGWKLSTADFKTAFLQAPRREHGNRTTIVTPPQVLRDLQVMKCGDQERWEVKGALYGLAESPKDWSCFRDARMREMRWKDENFESWLESTQEAHLWKVKRKAIHQDHYKEEKGERSTDGVEVIAMIGVYVDDLIVSAEESEMKRILDEFAKSFKMAEPEMINEKTTVTFCGYEIKEVNGGFEVGQSKYAREMIKRRGIETTEAVPCPKLEEDVDEEMDMAALKEAQQLTGELSWLASRTRPDLTYTVGVMSRLLHRRPRYVCKIGWWAMRYVAGTCSRVLRFEAVPKDEIGTLVAAVDTSYAPSTRELQVYPRDDDYPWKKPTHVVVNEATICSTIDM